MGAVADAALAAGGDVVGVIPQALMDREVGHTGLTELHVVQTMHERKQLMAERADAFVALPGGIGTLEELFEVWTWRQLGYHDKPVGAARRRGLLRRRCWNSCASATSAASCRRRSTTPCWSTDDPTRLLARVGEAAAQGHGARRLLEDLDRRFVGLAGADAHHLLDRRDEDLAVADLAGLGRLDDGLDAAVDVGCPSTTTSIFTLGRKSTVYSLPR